MEEKQKQKKTVLKPEQIKKIVANGDLSTATQLVLTNKNILKIEPLHGLVNLRKLVLSNNFIKDISVKDFDFDTV